LPKEGSGFERVWELTPQLLCVKMCCVKTVTIREAQHNLAGILREVETGSVVEILRRKSPVARIVPVGHHGSTEEPVDWEGHEELMAAVWQGGCIHRVDEVLDDLRGR
jgi:prevent-host-death family protein